MPSETADIDDMALLAHPDQPSVVSEVRTPRVGIMGAPTGPSLVQQLIAALDLTAEQVVECDDPTVWETITIKPTFDIEPYQPCITDFGDRYTGKCKRLRREARGW